MPNNIMGLSVCTSQKLPLSSSQSGMNGCHWLPQCTPFQKPSLNLGVATNPKHFRVNDWLLFIVAMRCLPPKPLKRCRQRHHCVTYLNSRHWKLAVFPLNAQEPRGFYRIGSIYLVSCVHFVNLSIVLRPRTFEKSSPLSSYRSRLQLPTPV